MLPVVYNFVHLCQMTDVAIRTSSAHAISLVLQRASDDGADFVNTRAEDELSLGRIVQKILLPAVLKGLRGKDAAVRNTFVELLQKMVDLFPNQPRLEGLKSLRNETEPERDFFLNVRHIQVHRRMRAVNMLTRATEVGSISTIVTTAVLHPLIEHFVFETVKENEQIYGKS